MDSQGEAMIRSELEGLAERGAPIAVLDSSLKDHSLSGEEYDEMWLYAHLAGIGCQSTATP